MSLEKLTPLALALAALTPACDGVSVLSSPVDATVARDATPDVTAPDVTTPDVTAPDVTAPDVFDAGEDLGLMDAALDVDTGPDVQCATGQRVVGTACVSGTPRLVAPLSLGDVTQRRPTLRWTLPTNLDGASVDLCRDRACTLVIETVVATGTSARPTADLPASATIFWRVRGRAGDATDTQTSATWLFHTPATSASGGVDTSFGAHVDVNGDGFDDVALTGGDDGFRVHAGSATGPAATATTTVTTGGVRLRLAGAGDVNGDGFGDLVVVRTSTVAAASTTASIYAGSATGLATTPLVTLRSRDTATPRARDVATAAGDLNGDGYGDLAYGEPGGADFANNPTGSVALFLGGAMGLSSTAAQVLSDSSMLTGLGASLTATDVNGDGLGDLVVGAPGLTADVSGTVRVYAGQRGGDSVVMASAVVRAPTGRRDLGASLAAADLNGDGYGDVLAGAPAGNAVLAFSGGATGLSTDAPAVLTDTGAGVGAWLARGGDTNGDGFGDAVLSDQPSMAVNNRALVFAGASAGVSTTPVALRPAETLTTSISFATALAAGDVNGDGFLDLLVNAAAPANQLRVYFGGASGVATTASVTLTTPSITAAWQVAN